MPIPADHSGKSMKRVHGTVNDQHIFNRHCHSKCFATFKPLDMQRLIRSASALLGHDKTCANILFFSIFVDQ